MLNEYDIIGPAKNNQSYARIILKNILGLEPFSTQLLKLHIKHKCALLNAENQGSITKIPPLRYLKLP